jgi:hypothetical protein
VGLNLKGSLKPGADADIVIWNPDREFKVEASMLHHRHKLTPYADEVPSRRRGKDFPSRDRWFMMTANLFLVRLAEWFCGQVNSRTKALRNSGGYREPAAEQRSELSPRVRLCEPWGRIVGF